MYEVESAGLMTDDEFYDTDDAINASPPLEKAVVNYKPEESPPPFVPEITSSSSPETAEGDAAKEGDTGTEEGPRRPKKARRKRKKQRTRPSQGDTVLISYLEPNRPDIAQQVGQTALNSASQSEAGDEEEEDMGVAQDPEHDNKNLNPEAAVAAASAALAAVVDDVDMGDSPAERHDNEDDLSHAALPNGVDEDQASMDTGRISPKQTSKPSLNPGLDIRPPPRIPRSAPHINTEGIKPEEPNPEEDSIATSPNLAKFAIGPSEADPESTLPAMQKSPPRSASTHSPEGSQSLPSLQTALSQLGDPGMNGLHGTSPFPPTSGQSPTMTRHSPYPAQQSGPSPGMYAQPSPGMSPPGLPSHPSYWRTAPKDGSISTPSVFDGSTPSSITGQSPANSYPTPNIQDHRMSVEGSVTPQLINGPLPANGPFTSSSFKCTHTGCNALPFQTQYLLNSHANVHSSNRPHFCPVKDCPRGPGGKGFKRKNEMIRHGLVHQSPGYIW